MLLTFPSTFKAEFRAMRGAEISAMANQPDATSNDVIQDLLRATWVRTGDSGPYAFEGAPQFDKVLTGDLLYGLVASALHNVPKGDLYKFQVQCERLHPKRQYEWSVNLRTQLLERADDDGNLLAVRSLSSDTVAHLRAHGNAFTGTLAGVEVQYKLQSPSDTKHSNDLRKHVRRFTPAEQLAVQITSIKGVGRDGKASVRERWEWLKQLDAAELYRFHDDLTAKDCGLETAISTKCPECEWEQEVDLPFARLFSPRGRS